MIWNERECNMLMIDIKQNKISLVLTSEPWSTKNLTMSIDFCLIAIESGVSIFQNIFHLIMIDMKWKRMPFNND